MKKIFATTLLLCSLFVGCQTDNLDENGKVIKENRVVNLVPREKVQWGYTAVVKKAIINAILVWECENGL